MGQPHRRGSTGKLKESSFVCIAVYSKGAREIGTIDFSDPFLNYNRVLDENGRGEGIFECYVFFGMGK